MNDIERMILDELHIKPEEKFKIQLNNIGIEPGEYVIDNYMIIYKIKNNVKDIIHNQSDFIINLIKGNLKIKKNITDEELITLKALKINGYNYIARDADNDLYAYSEKPYAWRSPEPCKLHTCKLHSGLFPQITWLNEYLSVEDLLKEAEEI